MNVSNTGGVGGTQPVRPVGPARAAEQAYRSERTTRTEKTDSAEISDEARLRAKLDETPAVREDKIAQLKKLIESGEYETPERIQGAIERMMDESL